MQSIRSKILKGFVLFLLGLCAGALSAQTTVVSSTGVVDSDGTTWANANWSISFQVNPNYPNINTYLINGAALNPSIAYQKGTLNGSGVLSVTVYDNTQITPSGSSWALQMCPLASSGCSLYNFSTAGASLNITSALNAVLKAPRFNAVANSFGYADVEAQITLPIGATYYNTASLCQRNYNGSTWACTGGSGFSPTFANGSPSGSCTNNSVYFNTASTPYVQYVCNSTTWVQVGGGGSGGLPSASTIPAYVQYNSPGTTGVAVQAGAGNTALLPQQSGTIPYPETYGTPVQTATIGTANFYTTCYQDGDSIMAGNGPPLPTQAHAYLLAAFLGCIGTQYNGSTYTPVSGSPVYNTAVSGSMIADVLNRVYNFWPPATLSDTNFRQIQDGLNDSTHIGIGVNESLYVNGLKAAAVFNTMPFAYTGSSFGTVPTNWALDSGVSSVTHYTQVTGITSSTNGAVATFPYTTTVLGQAVALVYVCYDNNAGFATVTDSGGAGEQVVGICGGLSYQGNINNTGSTWGSWYMPQAIILNNPNRAAGTYNVTVTVKSATGVVGGAGYTSNPTCLVSTAGGGSGGTCTAVETSGTVTGVTVTAGGSYQQPPLITFSAGGAGSITQVAEAQAVLAGGALTGIGVTSGGWFPTSTPPTVSFNGCGGTGAVAGTPVMVAAGTGYTIQSVPLSSGGSGYICQPIVTTTPNGGAKLSSGNANSAITAINLVPSNQVQILGIALAPATISATTPKFFFDPVYRQEFDNNSLATQAYFNDGMAVCRELRADNIEMYCPNTRNSMNGNAIEMVGLHPTAQGSIQLANLELQQIPFYPPGLVNTQDPVSIETYLGPARNIGMANGFAWMACSDTHVGFTGAVSGTAYLPPGNCVQRPGTGVLGFNEDQWLFVNNLMSSNTVTLSTTYSQSAGGNVNGLVLQAGENCLLYTHVRVWYVSTCYPVALTSGVIVPTPTITGNPTFSGGNLMTLASGNNNEYDINCRPGSSANQSCFLVGESYTGTALWKIGFLTMANPQIIDVANSVTRLSMTAGGITTLASGGTQSVALNVGTGLGTGGVTFGSGASATPVATMTSAGILDAAGLGQNAASTYGGTCTMAAATSCTVTISHTYTTPECSATVQSATPLYAGCTVSGTTVTITASASNSSIWSALVWGNPN